MMYDLENEFEYYLKRGEQKNRKKTSITTLNLPIAYVNFIDRLVEEGRYPSRSYAIRQWVHESRESLHDDIFDFRILTVNLFDEDKAVIKSKMPTVSFSEYIRTLVGKYYDEFSEEEEEEDD